MNLTSDVLTTDAASELKKRLQTLIDNLYQTSGSVEEKIAHYLTDQEYNRLMQYSRENDLNLTDPQVIQTILQDIHAELSKRPVMSLTLAFLPTRSYLNELREHLSAHNPGPILVSIETNPEIVAGVVIHFQGKIFDYSYKEAIV